MEARDESEYTVHGMRMRCARARRFCRSFPRLAQSGQPRPAFPRAFLSDGEGPGSVSAWTCAWKTTTQAGRRVGRAGAVWCACPSRGVPAAGHRAGGRPRRVMHRCSGGSQATLCCSGPQGPPRRLSTAGNVGGSAPRFTPVRCTVLYSGFLLPSSLLLVDELKWGFQNSVRRRLVDCSNFERLVLPNIIIQTSNKDSKTTILINSFI